MKAPVVIEGSAFPLQVFFRDAAGNPATPLAVEYRIWDEATAADVRQTSQINGPLGPVIDIPIGTADTMHLSNSGDCCPEMRVVVVTATFGANDKWVSEHRFAVQPQPGSGLATVATVIDGGTPNSVDVDEIDGGTP